MTIEQLQKAAVPLHAARARQAMARLDYFRGVRGLSGQATQAELARVLGVSQPAISRALKASSTLPRILEGFHGADPSEIIARFAAGDKTREQVDELTRWPYEPTDKLHGPLDDVASFVPGSLDDLARAMSAGSCRHTSTSRQQALQLADERRPERLELGCPTVQLHRGRLKSVAGRF